MTRLLSDFKGSLGLFHYVSFGHEKDPIVESTRDVSQLYINQCATVVEDAKTPLPDSLSVLKQEMQRNRRRTWDLRHVDTWLPFVCSSYFCFMVSYGMIQLVSLFVAQAPREYAPSLEAWIWREVIYFEAALRRNGKRSYASSLRSLPATLFLHDLLETADLLTTVMLKRPESLPFISSTVPTAPMAPIAPMAPPPLCDVCLEEHPPWVEPRQCDWDRFESVIRSSVVNSIHRRILAEWTDPRFCFQPLALYSSFVRASPDTVGRHLEIPVEPQVPLYTFPFEESKFDRDMEGVDADIKTTDVLQDVLQDVLVETSDVGIFGSAEAAAEDGEWCRLIQWRRYNEVGLRVDVYQHSKIWSRTEFMVEKGKIIVTSINSGASGQAFNFWKQVEAKEYSHVVITHHYRAGKLYQTELRGVPEKGSRLRMEWRCFNSTHGRMLVKTPTRAGYDFQCEGHIDLDSLFLRSSGPINVPEILAEFGSKTLNPVRLGVDEASGAGAAKPDYFPRTPVAVDFIAEPHDQTLGSRSRRFWLELLGLTPSSNKWVLSNVLDEGPSKTSRIAASVGVATRSTRTLFFNARADAKDSTCTLVHHNYSTQSSKLVYSWSPSYDKLIFQNEYEQSSLKRQWQIVKQV